MFGLAFGGQLPAWGWFDMFDPLGRHGVAGVAGVTRPGYLGEPLHSFGAQPVEP